MAISIKNRQYSFIKFGQPDDEPDCCDDKIILLPVCEESDLYFQVTLVMDSIDEYDAVDALGVTEIQLLLLSSDGTELRNWTVTDNLQFTKNRTGLTEMTLAWMEDLRDIKTLLSCDQCFKLGFKIPSVTLSEGEEPITISEQSDVFVFKCDPCYTAVLEYSNIKDYGDFLYCNVPYFSNRVRLPMYLDQPQTVEDKTVYTKSDGVIKQNSSVLAKEYNLLTDWLTEKVHDRIAVALAHNQQVNIYDAKYSGGISKVGNYTADWQTDVVMCTAPATAKIRAYGFTLLNGNCTDCDPVVIPAPCVPVSIEGVGELPTAQVGVPFNYVFNLIGLAPFSLNSNDSSSWITITLVGTTIVVTGTPTDDFEGVESSLIKFTIGGCESSTASIDLGVSVDAAEEGCIPVEVVGTIDFPNAVEDAEYNYTINLTGTAPFILSDLVKPDWMTVTVIVSTIVFAGTPTDTETGINISFGINNCTNVTSIDQSIDVVDNGLISFAGNGFSGCEGATMQATVFVNGVEYNRHSSPIIATPGDYEIIPRARFIQASPTPTECLGTNVIIYSPDATGDILTSCWTSGVPEFVNGMAYTLHIDAGQSVTLFIQIDTP